MDSEAGLLLPAGNFPYPPRVHFFNELRLFDVLEQMDIKYVLNTIPVTVGLTSANQGLISTPSATADLHQRGMQLESWVMKPWEPRINSQNQADVWDQLQKEGLATELGSGERGSQLLTWRNPLRWWRRRAEEVLEFSEQSQPLQAGLSSVWLTPICNFDSFSVHKSNLSTDDYLI